MVSNATRWDTFEGMVGQDKLPESGARPCRVAARAAGRGGSPAAVLPQPARGSARAARLRAPLHAPRLHWPTMRALSRRAAQSACSGSGTRRRPRSCPSTWGSRRTRCRPAPVRLARADGAGHAAPRRARPALVCWPRLGAAPVARAPCRAAPCPAGTGVLAPTWSRARHPRPLPRRARRVPPDHRGGLGQDGGGWGAAALLRWLAPGAEGAGRGPRVAPGSALVREGPPPQTAPACALLCSPPAPAAQPAHPTHPPTRPPCPGPLRHPVCLHPLAAGPLAVPARHPHLPRIHVSAGGRAANGRGAGGGRRRHAHRPRIPMSARRGARWGRGAGAQGALSPVHRPASSPLPSFF